MLLLIDAGNTRIKWAVVDTTVATKLGEWLQIGSLSHQELIDGCVPWEQFALQRIVVSNVAGSELKAQLLNSFKNKQDIEQDIVEWFVPEANKAGVTNRYRDPAQLGSDRFAAAIGARALFPGQTILIATCGTALTMDVLSADGIFMGGMIAPGLKLMAQSLAENTAQLPIVPEHIASKESFVAHFADNTEEAMVSGFLAAQAGAIEHAYRECATMNQADPLCIVSGGGAKYVMPSLQISHQFVDNLVLIGLKSASL